MTHEQYSRETGLSIEEAGRLIARLRSSDRPASATIWRWCKRGLQAKFLSSADKGASKALTDQKVRLEYRRFGGRIMTTEQAVRRFLEATQDRDLPANPGDAASPSRPTVTDTANATSANERIASFMRASPQTRRPHPQERRRGSSSFNGKAAC